MLQRVRHRSRRQSVRDTPAQTTLSAPKYIVVTTTVDDREVAERIAAALVMAGLAACVQVSGPLESRYVWNGVHERSTEWLCTVKSRGDRFDELRRAIEEIHPYETPEIIAIPVCSVSERYAAWIDAATSGRG